jgi:hypothetical protein
MPMPLQIQRGTFTNPATNATLNVQFNPESLAVTYALMNPHGTEEPAQRTNHGSALRRKLSLSLVFDVSLMPAGPDDVQTITAQLAQFFTPAAADAALPDIQFQWGTFLLTGAITAFTETLEFFSADGTPLRSRVSLEMLEATDRQVVAPGTAAAQRQVKQFAAILGLQALVALVGVVATAAQAASVKATPPHWKSVGNALGIEDPRQLSHFRR